MIWSWVGEEGVESPRTVVWGRKREAMMILWLRRELIAADDEERTVGAVLGGEGEYLCSDQFSSMTSGATCVLAIDSAPGAGADRGAGAAEGAIWRRLEERMGAMAGYMHTTIVGRGRGGRRPYVGSTSANGPSTTCRLNVRQIAGQDSLILAGRLPPRLTARHPSPSSPASSSNLVLFSKPAPGRGEISLRPRGDGCSRLRVLTVWFCHLADCQRTDALMPTEKSSVCYVYKVYMSSTSYYLHLIVYLVATPVYVSSCAATEQKLNY